MLFGDAKVQVDAILSELKGGGGGGAATGAHGRPAMAAAH